MIEAANGFSADVQFHYPDWLRKSWRACRALTLSSLRSERSCCSGSSSTRTPRSSLRNWRKTASTFSRRGAVGDNRKRIAGAMAAALERADGVITTGGLGPTVDDLTKEAICELLDVDTELHQPSLRRDGSVLRASSDARCARTIASRPKCRAAVTSWKIRRNGAGFRRLPKRRQIRRMHARRSARDAPDADRAS